MKIERHVIQGLEPSQRVVDVDLAPAGEPVALVREANGTDGRLGMLFRGQTLALDMPVRFPLIRALDGKEVIIADSRIRREGDLNAWILASTGDTILRFSAGDAIENILVSGTDIVVGYFDEGGMTWPGQEGLAVFESTGRYKFGYNGPLFSAGEDNPFIMDCYATCLYGERHVAFHFLTGAERMRIS